MLVWFYAREFDVQMSQHVDSASFAKITLNCPDAVIALKDRLAHDLALNSTAVFEQPSRYESSESVNFTSLIPEMSLFRCVKFNSTMNSKFGPHIILKKGGLILVQKKSTLYIC